MNMRIVFASFALVFLAELGDKTQLTALAFTSSSRSPWSVFVGTSLALICATALAVVLGDLLARVVPENVLHMLSGVMFIIIGMLLLLSLARKAPNPASAPAAPTAVEIAAGQHLPRGLLPRLLLEQAVQLEKDSAVYFRELAQQTLQPQIQTILIQLADDEDEHARSLSMIIEPSPAELANVQVPRQPGLPGLPPLPSLDFAAGLPVALRKALEAEESIAAFYLSLARIAKLDSVRRALQWLAAAELQHVRDLEELAAQLTDNAESLS